MVNMYIYYLLTPEHTTVNEERSENIQLSTNLNYYHKSVKGDAIDQYSCSKKTQT